MIITMTFDMARKCKREGRKTISTEDLFQTMQFLGNAIMLHKSHDYEAKKI